MPNGSEGPRVGRIHRKCDACGQCNRAHQRDREPGLRGDRRAHGLRRDAAAAAAGRRPDAGCRGEGGQRPELVRLHRAGHDREVRERDPDDQRSLG